MTPPTSTDAPVSIETLLSHRAWVQRLARSLARDESSAAELEQRTWLAALRRPPRNAATSRAWLGTVLRNVARDARRAAGRRARHESAVLPAVHARATAEVVAEAEAHRRVVRAVHTLDEPYRSTVLLRWFEGLPPRTVAERMGVPSETVRTRLRRAHARLRTLLVELDPRGRNVLTVLAPLVAAPACVTGTGGAAPLTHSFGGSLVAGKTVTTVVVVAVAALAFVAGTAVDPGARNDATTGDRSAEVAALQERIDELESNDRRHRQGQARARAVGDADAAAPSGTVPLSERETEMQRAIDDLRAQLDAARAAADASPARTVAVERVVDIEALRELPDDEVLKTIRKMIAVEMHGARVDGEGVLEACDVLLARSLTDAARSEGLRLKGIGHRVLHETDKEIAAFREAVVAAGTGTPDARLAQTQLAWTAARSGDHDAAAEEFLRLAEDPDAPDRQRAWNRFYAAGRLEDAGDTDGAIAQWRRLIDDFGESEHPDIEVVVTQTKRQLHRLK